MDFSRKCTLCAATENLKVCSKCKMITYCTKEHQLEDWAYHKSVCKEYRKQNKLAHSTVREPKPINENVSVNARSDNKKKADDHFNIAESNTGSNGRDYSNSLDITNNSSVVKSVTQREQSQNHRSSPTSPKRSFPQPHDIKSVPFYVYSQLIKDNFCVLDNVFPHKIALALLQEVKELYSRGTFVPGQLGGGKISNKNAQKYTEKKIRGDVITLIEGNEPYVPYISELVKYLAAVVGRVNGFLKGKYIISQRSKVMVACYPGNGTGYTCHVDNPNKDGRCITCLYYLNPNWDAKIQGGVLRLYPEGADEPVDVEPILNRVIFFWSDRRCPHEVRPTFDTRYAITVWYFDKKEREEARQAQLEEDFRKTKGDLAMMNIKNKDLIENSEDQAKCAAIS